MTAVAAEAAVVVDNGRETSGETSLWHGAAAGAAARVDPLLRRISGLTRFDRVSCGRWLVATASFPPPEERRLGAAPRMRSRGELCVDLRGVNGGLKATPPPLGPPRPTGSTRAACL